MVVALVGSIAAKAFWLCSLSIVRLAGTKWNGLNVVRGKRECQAAEMKVASLVEFNVGRGGVEMARCTGLALILQWLH